jgi:hypothetical protein
MKSPKSKALGKMKESKRLKVKHEGHPMHLQGWVDRPRKGAKATRLTIRGRKEYENHSTHSDNIPF